MFLKDTCGCFSPSLKVRCSLAPLLRPEFPVTWSCLLSEAFPRLGPCWVQSPAKGAPCLPGTVADGQSRPKAGDLSRWQCGVQVLWEPREGTYESDGGLSFSVEVAFEESSW